MPSQPNRSLNTPLVAIAARPTISIRIFGQRSDAGLRTGSYHLTNTVTFLLQIPEPGIAMKFLVSAVLAPFLLCSFAGHAGAGFMGGHKGDKGSSCVVTGWTDWPTTKPIFTCPQKTMRSKGRYKPAATAFRRGLKGHNSHACVVTGWTDWPTTKPVFACHYESARSKRRHRR